jgi:hypothetical protein
VKKNNFQMSICRQNLNSPLFFEKLLSPSHFFKCSNRNFPKVRLRQKLNVEMQEVKIRWLPYEKCTFVNKPSLISFKNKFCLHCSYSFFHFNEESINYP